MTHDEIIRRVKALEQIIYEECLGQHYDLVRREAVLEILRDADCARR